MAAFSCKKEEDTNITNGLLEKCFARQIIVIATGGGSRDRYREGLYKR